MATISKSNISSLVSEILLKHNYSLDDDLSKDLLNLFSKSKSNKAPKELEHQPLVDENGNITHLYCRWFKEYRDVTEFNKSTKSKNGYHYECKEAEKHWKAYAKEIAQTKEDILLEKNAVLDGVKTIEQAKEEIALLEAKLSQLELDRLNKINNPSLIIEESKEPTLVEDSKEIIKTFPKSKKSKDSKDA